MTPRRYAWRGNDRQGKRMEGERLANSKSEVIQWLCHQRIRPTKIHRQIDLFTWQFHAKSSLKHADITRLTRQLATLLQAGVPLLQALDVLLRGESHIRLVSLIRQIHHRLEGGLAFNQALREHAEFSGLYCNLVAVGEVTGELDKALERLAHYLEKAQALRAALRSALIYPLSVVTVAGVVIVIILVFVVPVFENIFQSFGAELPRPTRWVIAVSSAVQHHGLSAIGATGVVSWWLLHHYHQHAHWQINLHRLLLLRLPIAGTLIRHACTARWTRTLSTLFSSGIPLTEALDCVQRVTTNVLFASATVSIQQQLLQGVSLSKALQSMDGLFPPMVAQMSAIGEESGSLDHMLQKTAEYYEQDVDHTVARLSTLLEPFIMVLLGVFIGGLVIALYLPIFELGQAI